MITYVIVDKNCAAVTDALTFVGTNTQWDRFHHVLVPTNLSALQLRMPTSEWTGMALALYGASLVPRLPRSGTRNWSCAGVESLVFFVTWKRQR